MKKLILSAIVSAFVVGAYAGEACDGSSCCAKTQTTQTKSSTCTKSQKTYTKSNKNSTSKQPLQSPKAMSLASR